MVFLCHTSTESDLELINSLKDSPLEHVKISWEALQSDKTETNYE